MCRNQKFLHIWHVSDVENVSTYVQFMLFCCKIDFVTICALLSENLFCRDLRTFVWRKIEKEKLTNMRYEMQCQVQRERDPKQTLTDRHTGTKFINVSYKSSPSELLV